MALSDTLFRASNAARMAVEEIEDYLVPPSIYDASCRRQAEKIKALLEVAVAEMELLELHLDDPNAGPFAGRYTASAPFTVSRFAAEAIAESLRQR